MEALPVRLSEPEPPIRFSTVSSTESPSVSSPATPSASAVIAPVRAVPEAGE